MVASWSSSTSACLLKVEMQYPPPYKFHKGGNIPHASDDARPAADARPSAGKPGQTGKLEKADFDDDFDAETAISEARSTTAVSLAKLHHELSSLYQEAVTIETEVKTEMKDIASEMLPLLSRRILALKLVLGSCIDQPTATPESAEVDGTALRAQITAWGEEKTALPFMGFNELGTFAELAVMEQKFGE